MILPLAALGEEVLQEQAACGGEDPRRNWHFVVQPRVAAQVVQRPARPGSRVRRSEDQPADPTGNQCASAHRAGLESYDQSGVVQSPSSQVGGGVTKRKHFCMGTWVALQLSLVVPRSDDLAFDGHDRSDRHVAMARCKGRLGKCQAHGRCVTHIPNANGSAWGEAEAELAEAVGFEPTVGCPTHDFQSCRFGRSRTPPRAHRLVE